MRNLRIERLNSSHDRSLFRCGKYDLDEYLKRYSSQDEKRGYARVYVLVAKNSPRVVGFYTLSVGGIVFDDLPESIKPKVLRYPMPVAHLGRMAVDQEFQGNGYGAILLLSALKRSLEVSREIGIAAVEVTAKNEQVKQFYLKYGFTPLEDDLLHLYLPMETVRKLLQPD